MYLACPRAHLDFAKQPQRSTTQGKLPSIQARLSGTCCVGSEKEKKKKGKAWQRRVFRTPFDVLLSLGNLLLDLRQPCTYWWTFRGMCLDRILGP